MTPAGARPSGSSINPFGQALERWCGGQADEQTLALI
jgi:hypothetical protein